MAQTYFATTLPGLEEALQLELRAMRCKHTQIVSGGVEFEATRKGLYTALYTTRCAHRILLRLDDFRAGDLFTLHRKTQRIEWSRYLPPHAPLQLHITSHRSRLHSRDAIERTLIEALQDALPKAPPIPSRSLEDDASPHLSSDEANLPDKTNPSRSLQNADASPPPRSLQNADASPYPRSAQQDSPFGLWVRVEEDRCTLSFDATGPLLYQRGWRTATGEAPLRESIACALLWLLGWTPTQPLVDPVCGSGTFLIEAARLQAALPPRLPRPYLVQRWPDFDPALWEEVLHAPLLLPRWKARNPPSTEPSQLWGFDHDPNVIGYAKQNALRAEVSALTQFSTRSLDALLPPASTTGFLIANPPYGRRLSRKTPQQKGAEQVLLRRFADHFTGWQMGLLLPRDITPQHPALQAQEIARFRNGGFPVTFWRLSHPSS